MKPELKRMHAGYRRNIWALCLVWLMAIGCSDQKAQPSAVSLVRVNDQLISVSEFNRRYDAASAEFPVSMDADPVIETEMKLRLLNQLTEELILLERADELGLAISNQELSTAIEAIRADYPAGEFEKVLVEQAIVYDEWKAQLRMRLLKEKVVREDLETSIVLTPEEVSASYEAHFPDRGAAGGQKLNDTADNEKVIKLVRRQKAQDIYRSWLMDLQTRYDVEINTTAWEELIDP
jgi:hypothetical protein